MVLVPLEGDRIFILAGSHMQHLYAGQVRSRPDECDCRQSLQSGPDPPNGVVSSPRHSPPHISTMKSSQPGPFCHKVQHQVCSICVTDSRPQSNLQMCSIHELGRDICICLSPPPANPLLGPLEILANRAMSPHSGGSILA